MPRRHIPQIDHDSIRALVLPVLDGLDEMDPPAPDGTPDPAAPRATAVVRALNTYQQGRDAGPLILTCRTRHYDALSAHTEVLDAARIAVAPVDTADARDYLTGRALDAARWRPLTDHLAPTPAGPWRTVLSTPWRLCLTATVYHHHGNPAELLTLPGPDALDRHLLARYIPVATRTTPNPHGYTPHDVHRWLHHLTTHLDPTSTPQATATAGTEATDLVLHELWPLAGRTRVRATDALLTTLGVLTTLPLAWTTPQPVTGAVAAVIGTIAVVAGTKAITTGIPSRLQNPIRTPQARRSLAAGLAGGLAGGLVREPGTSLSGRAIINSDALFGLAVGLPAGLTFGPVFGLAGGLALGAEASRRYAVFLLCSRRRLPFRLGLFLDWAVTAGLMRYSGPAYQYRHRELQHWLRQHPEPPAVP